MLDERLLLLMYYITKRVFLFCDEWLFYYFLYKMLRNKYYKLLVIVALYGVCCIYTSYTNIEMIEHRLPGLNQYIFILSGSSVYNVLSSAWQTITSIIK